MENQLRPKLGLALSGAGNRSTFYIGFLEALDEARVKPDYITACSGGSLVAAAYACGALPEFKKKVLSLTKEDLRSYLVKGSGGGLFGLNLLEEEIRKYTKGLNFEDVRPLMGFVAVDIETGEKVLMSMGDIAHAACVSCALPGVFDPAKWGGKTLIDGGLLISVPAEYLAEAGMDISVGVNMRGTKHIFTEGQLTARKVYNFVKKVLFLEELNELFENWPGDEDLAVEVKPKLFSVIGRCLDLAIAANESDTDAWRAQCDLVITPNIPKFKRARFTPESLKLYYDIGRKVAEENIPAIRQLLAKKEKVMG